MGTNPMGPMPGSDDDQGADNDSQDIAECEQKIDAIDARLTAVENKLGMGGAKPVGLPTKATSGPMPFIGSMK